MISQSSNHIADKCLRHRCQFEQCNVELPAHRVWPFTVQVLSANLDRHALPIGLGLFISLRKRISLLCQNSTNVLSMSLCVGSSQVGKEKRKRQAYSHKALGGCHFGRFYGLPYTSFISLVLASFPLIDSGLQ